MVRQADIGIFPASRRTASGHGFFEYTVEIPQDIDPEQVASAEFLFEASAKELFGKDKEGDDIQGDYMLGGGTFDHCKSPNSYAMTDGIFHPSKVEVTVNGILAGKLDLKDDPADHRGILSWAAQPNERHMCEAGSYGELIRVQIPVEAISKDRILVIRLTVPEDTPDGGLAIYGKDFGRYPLDPTLIIRTK
jgi:Predicted transcriptional regulator